MNVAHARAVPVTLFLIVLLAAPVWFVTSKGAGTGAVVATVMIATAVVCLLCAYLSSRVD